MAAFCTKMRDNNTKIESLNTALKGSCEEVASSQKVTAEHFYRVSAKVARAEK